MEHLARGFFYPSYAYNRTLEAVGLRHWYDQVEENIVLGALPSSKTIKEVTEKFKVTHVLTLNEDHELGAFYANKADFEKHNVEVKRVVITDFVGVPSTEQIDEGADFIKSVVDDGKVVYVHCKAGRSRSSMILGAYYVKHRGMSAKEAYEFMQSKRSCVDWHGTHWTTMNGYEKLYQKKSDS